MARGRKMKGGDNDVLGTMLGTGLGVYAAKNATSMSGLLWTLAKYALVIVAILIAVAVVMSLLRVATTDHFVPIAPSKEGDEKVVTPAGNVIMY